MELPEHIEMSLLELLSVDYTNKIRGHLAYNRYLVGKNEVYRLSRLHFKFGCVREC